MLRNLCQSFREGFFDIVITREVETMKQIYVIALLCVILFCALMVLAGCSQEEGDTGGRTIIPEKKCVQDTECVAATCCHAKDAVNKQYAPNCKSAICTMSCEPETLDCGQGNVKCTQGECSVVLNVQ